MTAAKLGDPEAINWLVRTWTPRIYRYVYRMLSTEEDAKDLTQEILTKTLKTLHRFDQSRPFAPWIYRIARNACIDLQRKRRPISEAPIETIPDPSGTPYDRALASEDTARIREALDTIPAKYKEILILYHFEHMKYEQISQLLRVPMGTVMNRLFRARKLLKTAVQSQGGAST